VIPAVPAVLPVATPVPDTIEATTGLPLVHAPPGVALLSVLVTPSQKVSKPVMGAGGGNTVNVVVVIQPAAVVYVIVAVPGAGVADTAVTIPVPKPTEAMAGLLLLHVPPADGCVRVAVSP